MTISTRHHRLTSHNTVGRALECPVAADVEAYRHPSCAMRLPTGDKHDHALRHQRVTLCTPTRRSSTTERNIMGQLRTANKRHKRHLAAAVAAKSAARRAGACHEDDQESLLTGAKRSPLRSSAQDIPHPQALIAPDAELRHPVECSPQAKGKSSGETEEQVQNALRRDRRRDDVLADGALPMPRTSH